MRGTVYFARAGKSARRRLGLRAKSRLPEIKFPITYRGFRRDFRRVLTDKIESVEKQP
jgi:hypothetical protein